MAIPFCLANASTSSDVILAPPSLISSSSGHPVPGENNAGAPTALTFHLLLSGAPWKKKKKSPSFSKKGSITR
jgi:hypothetical protein